MIMIIILFNKLINKSLNNFKKMKTRYFNLINFYIIRHLLSSSSILPSTLSEAVELTATTGFAMLSLDLLFSVEPDVCFSSSDVDFIELGSLKLSLYGDENDKIKFPKILNKI